MGEKHDKIKETEPTKWYDSIKVTGKIWIWWFWDRVLI